MLGTITYLVITYPEFCIFCNGCLSCADTDIISGDGVLELNAVSIIYIRSLQSLLFGCIFSLLHFTISLQPTQL